MNDSSMDISYQINRQKIIFIGDISVGKTSIINVLMGQQFPQEYEASIGVDFFSKTIKYKGKQIKLQIWDSAGQEKFRSLIPNYIKGASLVFIIYDITKKKSFESVKSWIEFVNNYENANIAIVGNKTDLGDKREVTYDEGLKFCQELNYDFFEVSAKNNDNLNNMLFNSIVSLPIFLTINTDKFTNEEIVEKLLKENSEGVSIPENINNNSSRVENLNVVTNSNENKNMNNMNSNANGEISLKENKNQMISHEETQVFNQKRKCCFN